MSAACPQCGSRYLRPSRSRDFSETLGRLRFFSPLRCLDCDARFQAHTLTRDDFVYAACPRCHRTDLNGWTGKTFRDPPFLTRIAVTLGAHRWRCEYCRLNFASFRKRKEIFSFRRWERLEAARNQTQNTGKADTQEFPPVVEVQPTDPEHQSVED